MQKKNHKKSTNSSRIRKVYTLLGSICNQHSVVTNVLDDLYNKIGIIASEQSIDAEGTRSDDLKQQIVLLEELNQQEVETLSNFKVEMMRLFHRNEEATKLQSNETKGRENVETTKEEKSATKGKRNSETVEGIGNPSPSSVCLTETEKDKKISELSEIVDFYSSIVSQHDNEDKKRLSERLDISKMCSLCRNEKDSTAQMKGKECEKKATIDEEFKYNEERTTLLNHLNAMQQKISDLEFKLLAAAQWHYTMTSSNYVNSRVPQGVKTFACTPPAHCSINGDRIRAKIIPPEGGLCESANFKHIHGEVATVQHNGTNAMNSLFLKLRNLSPIKLSNPSNQELVLLQRITLYENALTELEEYEANRQRCFDEMEKTRAEFFSSMTEELEKRKRTIQNLLIERESFLKASNQHWSRSREEEMGCMSSSINPSTSIDKEFTFRSIPSGPQETYQIQFSNLSTSESKRRSQILAEAFETLNRILWGFCSTICDLSWKTVDSSSIGLFSECFDSSIETRREILQEKYKGAFDTVLLLYGSSLKAFRAIIEANSAECVSGLSDARSDIEMAVERIRTLKSQGYKNFQDH